MQKSHGMLGVNREPVSSSKEKKDADSGERGAQRQKRSKDKLIRLDDLVPDEKVVGDGNYSARLTQSKTKNTTKKGNMSEQKKKKVNVRDLKPTKDAKGGYLNGVYTRHLN
jgi:hypothetical protein